MKELAKLIDQCFDGKWVGDAIMLSSKNIRDKPIEKQKSATIDFGIDGAMKNWLSLILIQQH